MHAVKGIEDADITAASDDVAPPQVCKQQQQPVSQSVAEISRDVFSHAVTSISGCRISSPVPTSGRWKIGLGRLCACVADAERRDSRILALHRLKQQHSPVGLRFKYRIVC